MLKDSAKLKNFPCEEWRNQGNRLTPVKLESKNQDKKVTVERVEGREVPNERLGCINHYQSRI